MVAKKPQTLHVVVNKEGEILRIEGVDAEQAYEDRGDIPNLVSLKEKDRTIDTFKQIMKNTARFPWVWEKAIVMNNPELEADRIEVFSKPSDDVE